MCEPASPTDHVLQSECVSAACSVTGSALTSLLALAASRESVKKNRNKTISSGTAVPSGLTRIPSVCSPARAGARRKDIYTRSKRGGRGAEPTELCINQDVVVYQGINV